ncbi:hypothetical protein MUP46_00660 [Patescibacteria group bacterium]|nr:hypothetical protein [Patescibacteria group bacterium]
MPNPIEQGRTFSVLDILLLVQRKSEEGHILITPLEAKDILLDILFQYYEGDVKRSPARIRTDSKIEALRTICHLNIGEDEAVDFTEAVAKIEVSRRTEDEENIRRDAHPQYGSENSFRDTAF